MTTRLSASILIISAIVTLTYAVSALQTTEATFPGTNGRIAFLDYTDFDSQVMTMNPDGSDRSNISSTVDFESEPVFGPDGRTIVFRGWNKNELTAGSFLPNYAFYITDGVNPPTIIPNSMPEYYSPTISPDGQTLIFSKDFSDTSDIYRMNIDGTGLMQLTNTPSFGDYNPSWSPNGDKVVFARSNADTGDIDIWTMNPDGSDQQNFTGTPNRVENWPDWSPDGEWIIFAMSDAASTAGGSGPLNIAVMNADGSDIEMITNDPNLDQNSPEFSPDGQRILWIESPAIGAAGGGIEFTASIIVADADGTDRQNITPSGSIDLQADWGLDEPAPETLTWGDNNCSGAADPVDALLDLRFDAGLSTNTGDCPPLGEDVDIGDTYPWGDIDCSHAVDPVDGLKTLRFDAGLSVAQPQDCPPMGSEVEIVN